MRSGADRETARAHLVIHGLVQGVYFRASTREAAARAGVTGWVRNLPDGSVEAVIEGEKAKVEEVVNWCRQGPPGARVRTVDVQWEPPTGEFGSFEVRYGW